MEVTAKPPISERVNLRVVAFAVITLLLLGTPLYIFVRESVTGGIVDHGDYVNVDLKAMSTFEMDQNNGADEDVPEKWRGLSGRRVALEGEIWSPREAGGKVSEFQLVYSIAKCCLSGPPKVQHFVDARVPENRSVGVYGGVVRVVGTLHVNVVRENGKVLSVWQLDVESVDPIDS